VSQDRLRGAANLCRFLHGWLAGPAAGKPKSSPSGQTQWIEGAFNTDPPTDQMSRNRRDFDK
jgi:hypothetical protein